MWRAENGRTTEIWRGRQGALFEPAAIAPDGGGVAIVLRKHYRFVPGKQELVYLPTPSQVVAENFWLLDLTTMKTRQLASFDSRSARTFDITPDGKRIVFDRLQDHSDLVLIDLAGKH